MCTQYEFVLNQRIERTAILCMKQSAQVMYYRNKAFNKNAPDSMKQWYWQNALSYEDMIIRLTNWLMKDIEKETNYHEH